MLPQALRAPLALTPQAPAGRLAARPAAGRSPAPGRARRRVALLTGCAQQVLAPEINEATVRLLTRHGCEVVIAEGAGCCGALTHHLGQDGATCRARQHLGAGAREIEGGGLDAIVINASGCGTTVKDYGYMFRDDPALADKAQRVSALRARRHAS